MNSSLHFSIHQHDLDTETPKDSYEFFSALGQEHL